MAYPNLKAEMARKGISGNEMAKTVGIAPQTFSSWMTGKYEPSISKAMAIADALDAPIAYLFADEPGIPSA